MSKTIWLNDPDLKEKLGHGALEDQAKVEVRRGHARLGPSNHRWPNCPGSVREEANYEDISGPAAIDGTGSHELLELCLNNGVRAESYDGQIIAHNHPDNLGGWLVGPGRIERVQVCLDYVARRVKELKELYPDVRVESEGKSDPGGMFGRDDWWGTVDITIVCRNAEGLVHFVEVIDYKDGRGWVREKDNTQLTGYMGGKLRPHVATGPAQVAPFRTEHIPAVRMTIVQPKTSRPIRYDTKSASNVIDVCVDMAKAAAATDDPNAPLIPDDKGGKGYCQWCKHKKNCSAESQRGMEVMKTMSNDVIAGNGQSLFELVAQSISTVTSLTNEQLVELADVKAGMMSIFDKVEGEIQHRIEQEIPVSGFAMLPGRASKVWAEGEEKMVKVFKARKLVQADYYPKKLISPAQALKLSKLTPEQKVSLEQDYISLKMGNKSLTRVAHMEKETPELMFADVPVINGEIKQDFLPEEGGQSTDDVVQSGPEVSFF